MHVRVRVRLCGVQLMAHRFVDRARHLPPVRWRRTLRVEPRVPGIGASKEPAVRRRVGPAYVPGAPERLVLARAESGAAPELRTEPDVGGVGRQDVGVIEPHAVGWVRVVGLPPNGVARVATQAPRGGRGTRTPAPDSPPLSPRVGLGVEGPRTIFDLPPIH